MLILAGVNALPHRDRINTLLLAHHRCFNTAIHAAEPLPNVACGAVDPQHVIAVYAGIVLAVLSIKRTLGAAVPCFQVDDLLVMRTDGHPRSERGSNSGGAAGHGDLLIRRRHSSCGQHSTPVLGLVYAGWV